MNQLSKYFIAVLMALALLINAGPAQAASSDDGFISVPFDADHWEFQMQIREPDNGQSVFPSDGEAPIYCSSEKLEECKPALNPDNDPGTFYGEKNALYLRGGSAFVKGLDNFSNGIIEYDVLLKAPIAGFFGSLVRAVDDNNHERIFVRPHHSNQDDAIQYTPVSNQIQNWQLYYGDAYNAYAKYDYEKWLHTKIIVNDSRAEVYLEDMENPLLYVPDLKRSIPKPSRIGLYSLNPGRLGGFFANYKYKIVDNPPLKNGAVPLPNAPEGSINSWERTNPFEEAYLKDKFVLTDADLARFEGQWTEYDADRIGVTLLANLYTPIKGENCILLGKTITSDSDRIKIFELGYSDRVKVFLNGELQYIGNNTYRYRHQSFLGIAGYFDKVALPLNEGDNQLYLAISATPVYTPGWGTMAKFEDTTGISF